MPPNPDRAHAVGGHRSDRRDDLLHPRIHLHRAGLRGVYPPQRHSGGEILNARAVLPHPGRHDHLAQFDLCDPRQTVDLFLPHQPNAAGDLLRHDLRLAAGQDE
uniref:(northern house mosquito) hypothetical protein n=1 Tax=Culex pipiens TaxID=7175 RepID=A0A8D8KXL7_CULPI